MQEQYTPYEKNLMRKYQRDEITASVIYKNIAAREKNPHNKEVLLKISSEEHEHALFWERYLGENAKPAKAKILFYGLLSLLFGYTFVIKLMEKNEYQGIEDMRLLQDKISNINDIIAQEKAHEAALIDLLDEERLKYVGAMVLGLNDALVELTGTIAGLTLALANTRLVALAGIITGISATLSMAASNYLAERASGSKDALKASVYTGIAYLITVVLLVAPYLIYPQDMYLAALFTMLAIMILIIFIFNYYVSVAKSLPFFKRFGEMAGISLGVAIISFVIGLLARYFLNIDI